jgi:transposase
LKSARSRMSMINAYREVGSYRGAAAVCGCDPKTVKRAVQRCESGGVGPERSERARNYDVVVDVVMARVERTSGRISAKRLLVEARAAGYGGSARNFRRLVALAKEQWRRSHHRGRRPAVWSPGDTLVIDWGAEGSLHVFCAVLAWSRWRFVRFAADERAETTLAMLAECFEAIGGVPKVVLADRMACLKGGVVANVVVPTPDYVRFATHYRFRPDFCEGGDPASKGIVENLVGYAKSDLVVPAEPQVGRMGEANSDARRWCAEVNAQVHSEICAVPAQRVVVEIELLAALPSLRPRIGRVTIRKVDKLACVRIGSARYSVPIRLIGRRVEVMAAEGRVKVLEGDEIVADHALVAPGEASIHDDHYGGARPDKPRRAVRPVTAAEKAFCALGPAAEAFLKQAAAAGVTKLGSELGELAALEAAHGRDVLVAALERATAFGRWRAGDVRSILAAGTGTPRPTGPGEALVIPLLIVPTRPLSDYAIESLR